MASLNILWRMMKNGPFKDQKWPLNFNTIYQLDLFCQGKWPKSHIVRTLWPCTKILIRPYSFSRAQEHPSPHPAPLNPPSAQLPQTLLLLFIYHLPVFCRVLYVLPLVSLENRLLPRSCTCLSLFPELLISSLFASSFVGQIWNICWEN